MTDKELVKKFYPDAYGFIGFVGPWKIFRTTKWYQISIGRGPTEDEAWADAAQRLYPEAEAKP